MHLILRYSNGQGTEALLLTMTPDTLRVILHRRNETIEYRLVSGRWSGDGGSRVAIEAMLPVTASAPPDAAGLTLAAGG